MKLIGHVFSDLRSRVQRRPAAERPLKLRLADQADTQAKSSEKTGR